MITERHRQLIGDHRNAERLNNRKMAGMPAIPDGQNSLSA